VSCPLCREPWSAPPPAARPAPAGASGAAAVAARGPDSEGYVNVADLAGVPVQRDTSSYSSGYSGYGGGSGWRRGWRADDYYGGFKRKRGWW
jgi:hypothetical protein